MDKDTRSLTEPEFALTRRQRQVAALVSAGASNREIARSLGLSERTAQSYVSHILQRLGLRSRTELALWVIEHGIEGRPLSRWHD